MPRSTSTLPTRLLHLACIFLVLVITFSAPPHVLAQTGAPEQRAEILVLVNAESSAFPNFARQIQPYLDNFGIPYRVLDLSQNPLPADLPRYAAILIGHARLDVEGQRLDSAAQQRLVEAVKNGAGLINFDNDLSTGKHGQPRYAFIQDIFGFAYTPKKTGFGLQFHHPADHYITALHSPREKITTSRITTAGIIAPASAAVLAVMFDGQPFLTITHPGSGRAVQWASTDWISDPLRGPVSGMDDLLWRSIVWAARKPFVMQAMPPFVTMRVDDVSGPLWWAHTASEAFPFKPWIGVFMNDFTKAEADDLSHLVKEGKATALVHSFTMKNFLYGSHLAGRKTGANLPDTLMARNLEQGLQWHITNDVPLSKFTVGHYYEMSANAFPLLERWGVEFVGTLMQPGQNYGSPWVQEGPYRLYTRGSSKSTRPFYYADTIRVPGHPELDGRFFNCMTEIRDDAGYEWFPGRDVPGSIQRGLRQTNRALNSLVLATLFTHEYHIQEAGPRSWSAILTGLIEQLADRKPIYVPLDQACQYARAIHTSRIAASRFDPAARIFSTTMSGSTDMPTMLYLFTEQDGQVIQQFLTVPVFQNSLHLTNAIP